MNAFEYIISPFIFIIKQIILFSYQVTDSYGVAIILLSFFISLLLLPIFILIEKSKKKDDLVKNKIQPLIDEIKRVYKGQERYYYIKTINRQHNYSSFKALIPILSLLLQIPFFIAAFQFLDGYEPLKGVSFLFIKDLSQADGLFGIINFLPIFMTLVNLLTAYFYTRNGNTSERKQMYIVAGAFLILLFNLPSGLVLYWTMNNVFSFLRLFITNPEVFKGGGKGFSFANFISKYKLQLPLLKKIFTGILLIAIFSQINWAFNNNFDEIYLRIFGAILGSFVLTSLIGITLTYREEYKKIISQIKVKPQIFFSLLFLTVYFYLSSIFYFTGENELLGIITILFLIPTQFIGYIYAKRFAKETKRKIYKNALFILHLLFSYQLILLGTYIAGEDTSLNILNMNILIKLASFSNIIAPGVIFSLISLSYYVAFNKIKFSNSSNPNWLIFSLSILYLIGFIYLWNPLISFSSFPEAFEYGGGDIIKNNFLPFLISIILSFILYLIIPKKYKIWGIITILVMVFFSFINNTAFPIDLGSLQINKYSNDAKLAAPIFHYLIEASSILVVFFLIKYLLISKKYLYIKFGLILLNIIIISQSLFLVINSGSFIKGNIKLEKRTVNNNQLFLNDEDLIHFSKTEKNIVFLMPDMFQGWAMEKILTEQPNFKDIYSGFVWYPNTLSVSRVTNSTMPALMGGFDFYPDKLDKDTMHNIHHKMTSAMKKVVKQAHSDGFNVTATKFPYCEAKELDYEYFLPVWAKSWNAYNDTLKISESSEDGYSILYQNALFYSSPLFLKPQIYNKGSWLSKYKPKKKKTKNTWVAKKYNFLRLLPHISKAKKGKGNLIMLYSFITHMPWNIVDDSGSLIKNVSPTTTAKWTIEKFAKWIQWMKDNNVYDNTKIIIVSDHGTHWGYLNDEFDINIPYKNIDEDKISIRQMFELNALLLVKDFNAKGSLKKDWRMMSNADVNSILFNKTNPLKMDAPKNRTLTGYISWWKKNIDQENKFSINKVYKVKNNIFDANNWEKIK